MTDSMPGVSLEEYEWSEKSGVGFFVYAVTDGEGNTFNRRWAREQKRYHVAK